MDPFEYAKSVADMWIAGSQAALSAQKAATQGMMAAMGVGGPPERPAMPDLATGMAELARASQAVGTLWQSAAALSQTLTSTLPWRGEDPTVAATFQKIADPRVWLNVTGDMDEFLSRMTDGPRFSDLWEVERKYARVSRAGLTLRQRAMEQNAVLLSAWQNAAEKFTRMLAAAGPDGASADAALRLWTNTANEVMQETQRSPAFLDAQAHMIAASTELSLAQQDLSEHYGAQFGFPTRRELDDVHKSVTELRRELRTLRRSMRPTQTAEG